MLAEIISPDHAAEIRLHQQVLESAHSLCVKLSVYDGQKLDEILHCRADMFRRNPERDFCFRIEPCFFDRLREDKFRHSFL